MLLYICDSRTVEDLQDHFNDCFPYLKLEFHIGDSSKIGCDKSTLARSSSLVGAIRTKSYSGVLDIKSWYTTSRVKEDMRNIFGLDVQVLRRHGIDWIPTTYSDELTLRQQGDLAGKISGPSPNDNCH